MSLKKQILDSIKSAMKAGEKEKLLVLRGFSAAIKQREVDERIELTDSDVLAILDKQIKQRKDSESQFRAANRADLADKEANEIKILAEFQPEQLSEDEISKIVDNAIAEVGESGMAAMGKVMAIIKPLAQGKADISQISRLVKEKL